MVANSGIQDARVIPLGTHRSDVTESSSCIQSGTQIYYRYLQTLSRYPLNY